MCVQQAMERGVKNKGTTIRITIQMNQKKRRKRGRIRVMFSPAVVVCKCGGRKFARKASVPAIAFHKPVTAMPVFRSDV